jgi:hypothetical protein
MILKIFYSIIISENYEIMVLRVGETRSSEKLFNSLGTKLFLAQLSKVFLSGTQLILYLRWSKSQLSVAAI